MFSSQISSRDLFFSNPVERFLGNDAGLKTSLESGFSSSLGYSQGDHTKELLSGNSEDIFSQTTKATNEPQATKSDYQKYISQNLLFGKKGKPNKYVTANKENETNGKNLPYSENKEQELQGILEIKDKMESLLHGIVRLNADVSDVKDSVKGLETETTKQNERISTFEETFTQKTKMMEACEKYWKNHKEDFTVKLQKQISENFKETKAAIDKLKDMTEKSRNKIHETIRKSCTSQEVSNKRMLEEIKKGNNLILRKLTEKIDTLQKGFEESIEKLKNDCDENFDAKTEKLKTYMDNLHSSIKHIIASNRPNTYQSTMYKTPTAPISQHLPQSIFLSGRSNTSKASAYRPGVQFRKFEFSRVDSVLGPVPARALTQGSVHTTPIVDMIQRNNSNLKQTPLMEIMKRNKSLPNDLQANRNKIPRLSYQRDKNASTSKIDYVKNEKISPSTVSSDSSLKIVKEIRGPSYVVRRSHEYSRQCRSVNVRKKSAPTVEPKNVRRTNDFFSNFDSDLKNNEFIETKSQTKQNKRNLRPKRRRVNYNETDTLQSSPYLSMFEATMAKEYSYL
ncbi:hypothetical protein JTE90_003978 [Oedothorax gibbosus]|uniref:Uncharacterized protein n=1 Tax=Oedothorax gibbosus TaxID=931172 RepID=A0AAV6UEZ4_9ARAC|nr:hypothetical protein JTE90_003978 [Oedothorax gibbosus]